MTTASICCCSSRRATSQGDLAAIRAWAASSGVHVAARGRIAEDVRRQYEAARAGQPESLN